MEGVKNISRDLERIKKQFPKKVESFIVKQSNKLVKAVKQRTPVDNGTLRNAWLTDFRNKSKFEATVYNATDYVLPVEFGTRGGRRGVYMLTKSLEELKLTYQKDIENLIEEVLK